MDMKYFIDIINYDTAKVVKSISAHSRREAERLDGGVNINLDHENYYTLIREDLEEDTGSSS